MSNRFSQAGLVAPALAAGVAVPFLYFGAQLVAAPFYPGYSFLNRDASTLGSPGSTHPEIFNLAALLLGVLTLIASWGFAQAFQQLNVRPLLKWLTCLSLVSFAIGNFNAGLYPLPDPRHTSGPLAILAMGTFLLPVLLPIALWNLPRAAALRKFLAFNTAAMLALIPVLSGMIQIVLVKTGAQWPAYQDLLNNYHGLLQRVVAFLVTAPIGVAAYALAGRIGRAAQRDAGQP